MEQLDIFVLLALPDDELRKKLVSFIDNRQIENLFAFLNTLGSIDVSSVENRSMIWKQKEEKLTRLGDIYPILAKFVVDSYDDFVKLSKKYGGIYGFWGIMREMCIRYLMYLRCECGKPFDDIYFEEDGAHFKCKSYQKWAWAHLPSHMRRLYGILEDKK